MLNPNQLEEEFSIALVRLLRQFNLLELNLGLAISFLIDSKNPKSTYPKLSKMSLEKKLHEFCRLIEKSDLYRSHDYKNELNSWSSRATEARWIRNFYVHGHWQLLPLREERPVSLSAPPWMREKLGITKEIKMTIQELQNMAESMEYLFKDFMRLRKKLGV